MIHQGKAIPVHNMKACGGQEVWNHLFLASALDVGELHALAMQMGTELQSQSQFSGAEKNVLNDMLFILKYKQINRYTLLFYVMTLNFLLTKNSVTAILPTRDFLNNTIIRLTLLGSSH
jgi:hypothetical protein